MYRVFIPADPDGSGFSGLRSLLPGDVELSSKTGKAHMAVIGRPTPELLRAISPEILLIPYAGVHPETLELLRSLGSIRVHNLHHNAGAVAGMALALMLAAGLGIRASDAGLRRGDWSTRTDPGKTMLLEGSRVLILGFGSIGGRLGAACETLGARVRAIRLNPDTDPRVHTPDRLHQLLPETDFLAGCLPLTRRTHGMIGPDELALLHPRSVVVNVGRARVFHEEALYEALARGRIGGAGLDVWYRYPGDPKNTLPSDLPFHRLDNVVMSPHRAGAYGVPELELRRTEAIAGAILAGARGLAVPHPVNLELGY